MERNVSTVAFRSNLYPIKKSFYADANFRSQIHDPFSLELLKEQYLLTDFQMKEYNSASVHCTYADENDYPWGTIRDCQGNEQVVCRCLNTECKHFSTCRPDFDIDELSIREANKMAQPAIFEFEGALCKEDTLADGNAEALLQLITEDNLEQKSDEETRALVSDKEELDRDNPFVIRNIVQPAQQSVEIGEIDFTSFTETTQDKIIEANPVERCIVNAGPGTGKTWTLIEKIIYMINSEQAKAENILVLCFSRSAVELVRSRLSYAAGIGRIGYEWKEVDVRTFDSFATYMLAWVQDNHKELLPNQFILEACDYDQRIKVAASIFKEKKDMLAEYEHIIVDEVQDLVGVRAEMVLAMLKSLSASCGFTILGDSCQSLYDYMAENDPMVMSSEQFYQEIFKSFPSAYYYALTINHRQGDNLGQLTLPYRKAILTGSNQDRVLAASDLLANIPMMSVKLTRFAKSDALQYVGHGETLAILTRTNGQALQVSAWLQNADIPHTLHRGLGSLTLADWIACVFCDYENESIDESGFVTKHMALFPQAGYEIAQKRWMALVSAQRGELRRRYEVADLLKSLLRNVKEPMLYESGVDGKPAITVSNIHRAKGEEFDSVIVIDDVIESMADLDTENLLEHKVCYVALTRSKKKIERAAITKGNKKIYITRNDDQSKRCAKAGGRKLYISHFEVGIDTDLDTRSFAADNNLQQYIRLNIRSGMRLKLLKCPEETKSYVVYRIVPEDDERFVLGYTSQSFAHELEKAIQHIKKMSCPVYYEVYPHAFCDVYVQDIITCISEIAPAPEGARIFGDMGIWFGITIAGFAAVDKDTY